MGLLIDWDDVKAVAKSIETELDAIPIDEQTAILNQACVHVPEIYGGYTKPMQQYWAAHVAAQTFVLPAGEGAETTENIGSVSAARNQPVNNPHADQGHLETVYGRQYQYYLDVFKKRSTIAFGLFSNNEISGFPKGNPQCS